MRITVTSQFVDPIEPTDAELKIPLVTSKLRKRLLRNGIEVSISFSGKHS